MNINLQTPFVQHLGIRLLRADSGEAELTLDPRPEHLNTFGTVHGGVCMTLLDVAMSLAAQSGNELGSNAMTVEMKSTFMQPLRGKAACIGKIIFATRSLVFVEAWLRNEEGLLCSSSTGTFKWARTSVPPGS